jgi:hypothetical protein
MTPAWGVLRQTNCDHDSLPHPHPTQPLCFLTPPDYAGNASSVVTNKEHQLDPDQLDPNVRMDLEYVLQKNSDKIQEQYASYVYHLCERLKDKKITVEQLRTFLIRLPHQCGLSKIKSKLERTENTLNSIFDLIGDECASFFHYDIFQSIQKEYCTAEDCENPKMKYSKHFKDYVSLHKITEFFKINPKLKTKYTTDESRELTFKIENIDMSDKLGKIVNVRKAIAAILDTIPSALRLINIEEGCILVTFLIPTALAEVVYRTSAHQREQLRSLSVLRLRCGDYLLDLTHSDRQVSTQISVPFCFIE